MSQILILSIIIIFHKTLRSHTLQNFTYNNVNFNITEFFLPKFYIGIFNKIWYSIENAYIKFWEKKFELAEITQFVTEDNYDV